MNTKEWVNWIIKYNDWKWENWKWYFVGKWEQKYFPKDKDIKQE